MDDGRPFRGAEALATGTLSARELRRHYVAVYPGVYVPRWLEVSAVHRARAAWLWSRGRAVVSGMSASALHGSRWIDDTQPAELVHTNRRAPPMLTVHTDTLLPGETTCRDGMRLTTPARTAFDIGRRLPQAEAVQRVDALLNATRTCVGDVWAVLPGHPGVRGVTRLRTMLDLVDAGSESPYETLTRLMLVRGGLPPPQTQIEVVDEWGSTVAYLDMGWRDKKVAVEYDGAHHWTDARQRRRDIERWAQLQALGWIVIRISSDMLRTPATVVARVRAALASR